MLPELLTLSLCIIFIIIVIKKDMSLQWPVSSDQVASLQTQIDSFSTNYSNLGNLSADINTTIKNNSNPNYISTTRLFDGSVPSQLVFNDMLVVPFYEGQKDYSILYNTKPVLQ